MGIRMARLTQTHISRPIDHLTMQNVRSKYEDAVVVVVVGM